MLRYAEDSGIDEYKFVPVTEITKESDKKIDIDFNKIMSISNSYK